jgi:hypothetical protein
MKIMGLGIDYSTGEQLTAPMDEQDFALAILQSLGENSAAMKELAGLTEIASSFRGEVERDRTVDLGDPTAAGWTFLVNENDPQRDMLIEVLRPLAELRRMADPEEPLVFRNESPGQWFDWLLENYSPLNLGKVPQYVLIVGGPDQVPFAFQSLLQCRAAVGRVQFDGLVELEAYIEKIIRLEQAASPATARQAVFFATDGGPLDATHFSRRYMVEPLVEEVRGTWKLHASPLIGHQATKPQLLETLEKSNAALVYTASHGIGAPKESFEIQKKVNGAIVCQHTWGPSKKDILFTADDVPVDKPFLEGAVFFQFACHGYGTPAESDFHHWDHRARQWDTKADFIAALPKRLLAHPRGPIAFIGHLDEAFLHGFTDPDARFLVEKWHRRIEPFRSAVEAILHVQPVGLAMANMNARYNFCNALLTSTYDRLQRKKLEITKEFNSRLASEFVTRSDAQNYMVFGDPAVRLRIPTD